MLHRVYDSSGIGTYLLGGDGLLAGLAELLNGLLVVSQILLAADEDDGQALAEVQNLGDPLCNSNMVSQEWFYKACQPVTRGRRTFS